MIFLLCKSEKEMADSIAVVARERAAIGGQVLYCGATASACRAVAEARITAGDGSTCGIFRVLPLEADAGEGAETPLDDFLHSIDELLASHALGSARKLVWIDCPLPAARLAGDVTLAAYKWRLDRWAGELNARVVSCHVVADPASPLPRALLQHRYPVMTASLLTSWSPRWLFEPHAEEETAEPALAEPPADLAKYVYAENASDISVMAAGIAHELSNPLTLISSSLQYLHDRLATSKESAREFMLTALLSAERMRGLIEQLRNLAAPKELSMREVDLNALVQESLRIVAHECKQREITVEWALAMPSLMGRFDAARVTQVILNLLLNAIQASGNHGYLRVTTAVAAGGDEAIIGVENKGPQISKQVKKNLFRPFFTTKPTGTGLGLYISRQNARDHGGTIQVENLPDGVRFTVTLSLRLPG